MPNDGGIGSSFEEFLREHIARGESARTIAKAFRDAGGRMSNQAFRSAVANERAVMMAGPSLAQIPGHVTPTHDQFLPINWSKKGVYVYRLNMDVFDRGIGASVTQPWIVQSDRPISIQEAKDIAADQFANGDPENPNYGWGRVTTIELDQLRYTV